MSVQLVSKLENNLKNFVLASNGKASSLFTLVSEKTGKRFTYKVQKSTDGKVFFVKYLFGPENTSDYAYLGMIKEEVFTLTKKSQVGLDAPVYQAFSWFFSKLMKNEELVNLSVYHAGKCGRCGRTLTVPESIQSGFGPECIGKIF